VEIKLFVIGGEGNSYEGDHSGYFYLQYYGHFSIAQIFLQGYKLNDDEILAEP
jgi:hypothetical protein